MTMPVIFRCFLLLLFCTFKFLQKRVKRHQRRFTGSVHKGSDELPLSPEVGISVSGLLPVFIRKQTRWVLLYGKINIMCVTHLSFRELRLNLRITAVCHIARLQVCITAIWASTASWWRSEVWYCKPYLLNKSIWTIFQCPTYVIHKNNIIL